MIRGNAYATKGDGPMDEKKLMTIVNLASAVMILVLAGAFFAVIRAGVNAAAGH